VSRPQLQDRPGDQPSGAYEPATGARAPRGAKTCPPCCPDRRSSPAQPRRSCAHRWTSERGSRPARRTPVSSCSGLARMAARCPRADAVAGAIVAVGRRPQYATRSRPPPAPTARSSVRTRGAINESNARQVPSRRLAFWCMGGAVISPRVLKAPRLWGHCQLRGVGNSTCEFVGRRFDCDQHRIHFLIRSSPTRIGKHCSRRCEH
jgi:hypothetical protein